jgi:hypothetical protein
LGGLLARMNTRASCSLSTRSTSASILPPESFAAQPRLDDPGVVEHQQVAGAEEIRQLGEQPVRDHPGASLIHRHAAGGCRPAPAADNGR